ncbi:MULTISPECIES: hypothetical protein [Niastella]|uniref:Uncharacterized protein n=1 Tax=Niastella soli TaxID=2821487 RepID=A0ABS3YRR0_9BACT|nr:hypothetical protein [Niastella soli]MBO9199886.1 hypothetical protein [Niastella soli]
MRIVPFVNSLLVVCFLAVIASMTIMLTSTGYNDKVSHSCFILHAAAGFLLLARAAFKQDEEGESEEGEQVQ